MQPLETLPEIMPGITQLPAGFSCEVYTNGLGVLITKGADWTQVGLANRSREEAIQVIFASIAEMMVDRGDTDDIQD